MIRYVIHDWFHLTICIISFSHTLAGGWFDLASQFALTQWTSPTLPWGKTLSGGAHSCTEEHCTYCNWHWNKQMCKLWSTRKVQCCFCWFGASWFSPQQCCVWFGHKGSCPCCSTWLVCLLPPTLLITVGFISIKDCSAGGTGHSKPQTVFIYITYYFLKQEARTQRRKRERERRLNDKI